MQEPSNIMIYGINLYIIEMVSITNVSKEIIQTMDKRTDEDILLEAYRHYFKLAKAKNFGGKKRATSKNSEILYKVDKILLFFNKPSATAPENKKLMSQAKNVYQEYVSFKLSNEKFVTQSLERKMDAVEKWHKKDSNIYMASLFESVKVCYIPREQNTKADMVGRERTFTDIPTDFLEELIESRNDYKLQVIQKDNELSRLHEELEFVKNYFPNPQYNIPNLIEELRLLAEEREV
jgi:hypothetical protein